MTKAYSLQPYEQEQAAAIQREATSAATAYGNLSIQLKEAEAQLERVTAKQRCLIEVVAKRCAVPQNYLSARIETTNLMVEMPDEPQAAPSAQTVDVVPVAQAVNGHDLSAQQ